MFVSYFAVVFLLLVVLFQHILIKRLKILVSFAIFLALARTVFIVMVPFFLKKIL